MILSFHPCFVADQNIICAGRKPGDNDLAAIKAADAVILPQGCYASLYEMARNNCPNVFPNYDAKFKYPGKLGQSRLFSQINVPVPETRTFNTIEAFHNYYGGSPAKQHFSFPLVFKFDWGDQGTNVFLINTFLELEGLLEKAGHFEETGQKGFLIQEYIPTRNRSLRVVIIGQKIVSYWRVQKNSDTFCSNLGQGAVIDADSDPELQAQAVLSVKNFCKKTGINLAGFDFLFSSDAEIKTPLFLEINYFFGRCGLGGSENFYKLLIQEITNWIKRLNLKMGKR
jgi:ribosomal protein S6--L-glutamate ligase